MSPATRDLGRTRTLAGDVLAVDMRKMKCSSDSDGAGSRVDAADRSIVASASDAASVRCNSRSAFSRLMTSSTRFSFCSTFYIYIISTMC